MSSTGIRLPIDETFSVVTRKTFIQVDNSPIRKPHLDIARGRGRSMTDTAVVRDPENEDSLGMWADFDHEDPSTGTPSDNAMPETDDEDIGQGVITGVVYGESPEHSPCHAMYSRSLHVPVSPLHAPGSPMVTSAAPGSPSPLHLHAFNQGGLPGPFGMDGMRSGAQTPPGVWNPSVNSDTTRWGSPQPTRSPGQFPQSTRAMHQASRPLLASGPTWAPSAPPGQFASPSSPGPSRSPIVGLPVEQLMLAASLAASRSTPGSVASSRNASPSRSTPRTPSNVTSFPSSLQWSESNASKTTVVIRNLPHTYTREMVCEFMDDEGFKGRYNFVYLPTDFRSWLAFGYAFVNMVTPDDANDIMRCLEGFDAWKHDGEGKKCNVVWSDPYQGLEANIERYRNSPVMNESVSEQYKPMLFRDGLPVQFPAPTKKLRQPRIRRSSTSSECKPPDQEEF